LTLIDNTRGASKVISFPQMRELIKNREGKITAGDLPTKHQLGVGNGLKKTENKKKRLALPYDHLKKKGSAI